MCSPERREILVGARKDQSALEAGDDQHREFVGSTRLQARCLECVGERCSPTLKRILLRLSGEPVGKRDRRETLGAASRDWRIRNTSTDLELTGSALLPHAHRWPAFPTGRSEHDFLDVGWKTAARHVDCLR